MVRLSLPPPGNWQDFEELCLDLWGKLWNDPNAQKHGRSGQAQQGVDIFGHPGQGREWAGVQCKTTSELSSSKLEGLVEEARCFQPPLGQLIIATTAPRDAQLQAAVRTIDDRQRSGGSFSVTVYSWDDIISRLSDCPELLRKYYPAYFPRLDQGASSAVPRLEVRIDPNRELDYFSLLPAFSTTDPSISADLTVLTVGLSGIEVINHDDQPTEILRVWVDIYGETPREIMEEELRPGTRQLDARSSRIYELDFTAAFGGAPPSHRRDGVFLFAETIGLGKVGIPLAGLFQHQAVDPGREL